MSGWDFEERHESLLFFLADDSLVLMILFQLLYDEILFILLWCVETPVWVLWNFARFQILLPGFSASNQVIISTFRIFFQQALCVLWH